MRHIPKYDCTERAQWTSEKFYKSGLELIEAVLGILLYFKSESDSAVQGGRQREVVLTEIRVQSNNEAWCEGRGSILLLQKIAVW